MFRCIVNPFVSGATLFFGLDGYIDGHNFRRKSLNCFLYADDLVILSRSAKGLQNIFNKLESFCDYADLVVKLEKQKL